MIEKVTARYEQQNLEAAQIVLANIERYGGEGSGAVVWARLLILHARERFSVQAPHLPFANRRNETL